MPGIDERVLAIGIDAAEPTFVRRLIDEGELPTLKRLMDAGQWSAVESPAQIGSGAVWPTFFTGLEPSEHGIYSQWCWHPGRMALEGSSIRRLVPFWKTLVDDGIRVGVLDVPFAPLVGHSNGFEIHEWGMRENRNGYPQISPGTQRDMVPGGVPRHPFSPNPRWTNGPNDEVGLRKLVDDCLSGVRMRGRLVRELIAAHNPGLALVVFSEIHQAGHALWHTVASENPVYCDLGPTRSDQGLREIYRQVDREIASIVTAAGSVSAVLVFSLHGMEPARGVPWLLDDVLDDIGMQYRSAGVDRSWKGRGRSALTCAKRRTPTSMKRFYLNTVPPRIKNCVARQNMLLALDWGRTRAFALPTTDQHGWIRVNLAGREAEGVVPAEKYAETCSAIERRLRSLVADDGRPMVHDVIRCPPNGDGDDSHHLPDIVVNWAAAAHDPMVRVAGRGVPRMAPQLTGNHGPHGFCITSGQAVPGSDGAIASKDLHRLVVAAAKA